MFELPTIASKLNEKSWEKYIFCKSYFNTKHIGNNNNIEILHSSHMEVAQSPASSVYEHFYRALLCSLLALSSSMKLKECIHMLLSHKVLFPHFVPRVSFLRFGNF